MDIKHLRHFAVIVEEEQNMSRAAKRLHISQPPLSQQMKSIEQTLGVELFERHGRKLQLTQPGKLLYEYSTRIVNLFDEMKNEMQSIGNGARGNLTIAVSIFYSSHFPSSILFQKIKDFSLMYPDIKLRILHTDGNRLRDRMEAKEIDLAVMNLPIKEGKFTFLPLETQQLVCAIPSSWQYKANQMNLPFGDIKSFPLVLLRREAGNGLFEKVMEKCKDEGFAPSLVAESNDIQTVLSLVDAGIGATILPEAAVSRFPSENLRVLKFSDINFEAESVIFWLKERYLAKPSKLFLESFS